MNTKLWEGRFYKITEERGEGILRVQAESMAEALAKWRAVMGRGDREDPWQVEAEGDVQFVDAEGM